LRNKDIDMENQGEIILYQPDEVGELEVRLEDETVWLTQAQIAELFGTEVPAISKHIRNIIRSEEFEKEATVSKMETVRLEGSRKGELLTPKGISFGDCCLFSFPASSCHGFLGHGVGHPPLGSPQA
jgi:hypothetical protein